MRLIDRLREPQLPGVGRVHALTSAADACFAVSLAESLFFSVSLDAARPRIILYLALTMLPFVVLAPLVGPLIDRFHGGERLALVLANLLRAGLTMVMAIHLTDLLFYPEAFGILVLGKAYAVGRSAVIPHLVDDPDELVSANSQLSLISVLAGLGGAAVGVPLLNALGANWVLRVAGLMYLGGAVSALSVPKPRAAEPIPQVIEYEELHAPSPVLASAAMTVLRGAVGFLTFHLGFALKRGGEPAWFFGVVLLASGAGVLFGTVLAPRLKPRLHEEGMLAASLAVPAGLAVLAGIGFSRVGTVIAVLAVGLGSTVGRQAFDSLIQRDAPDADRARMFARFETYFQLGWVLGALVAVGLRLVAFAGMLVVAAVMGGAAVLYATSSRVLHHRPGARTGVVAWAQSLHDQQGFLLVGVETLVMAERLHVEGAYRQVVVQSAVAVDLLIEEVPPPAAGTGAPWGVSDEVVELGGLRKAALAPGATVSRAEALHALVLARRVMTRFVGGPEPGSSES